MSDLTTVDSSPSLNAYAERIRAAIAAAQESWSNALGRAMDAGDALIEVQPRVKMLGFTWKSWLNDNLSIKPSTAQLYAQLARNRDQVETALREDPHLSLRAARRLITTTKPSAPKCDAAAETTNNVESEAAESELPDVAAFVAFWRRVDRQTRTAILEKIGLHGDDGVLTALSQRQRGEIERRVAAHLPKPQSSKRTLTKIGKDARGRDVFLRGVRH
jgi:hypothetical protein